MLQQIRCYANTLRNDRVIAYPLTSAKFIVDLDDNDSDRDIETRYLDSVMTVIIFFQLFVLAF